MFDLQKISGIRRECGRCKSHFISETEYNRMRDYYVYGLGSKVKTPYNPGIKKIIQVIYMGTDSHYIPNKGEE